MAQDQAELWAALNDALGQAPAAGRQKAMLKQKNTPRGQGGRCSGSPSPPSSLAGLQDRIGEAFGAPPTQASPTPSPKLSVGTLPHGWQPPMATDQWWTSRQTGLCCAFRSVLLPKASPSSACSEPSLPSLWYIANSGPDPPPWHWTSCRQNFFFSRKH